jgi:hypothetical protein
MNTLCIKRIKKELQNIPYNSQDNFITFQYHRYHIKIVFTNYPFLPPYVYIDHSLLSYSPNSFPRRIFQEYCKIFSCPCCSSILCANNWNLNYTIIHILDQYTDFIKTLVSLQKIRVFKYIHLPTDLIKEISSFIFHPDIIHRLSF